MSSSPNSLSSSDVAVTGATDTGPVTGSFEAYRDVKCPVNVVLGTGTISVRQCLALERSSIIRLEQSAGDDLAVVVTGIRLARGEVVVVDDSTAIRLTEICRSGLKSSVPELFAPEPTA